MKDRPLGSPDRHSAVTYSEEDGRGYIGHKINMAPHIKQVQQFRDMQSYATRATNPNGWKHAARIPLPVLHDWLRKNRYTMNQWATNQGGNADDGTDGFYKRDKGVKSKFMRYFLSREFAMLHNSHHTTKQGVSQVSVPAAITRQAVDLTGIGA